MKRFRFSTLQGPVGFAGGSEQLLGLLSAITRGWQWQEVPDSGTEPVIRVGRDQGDYRIDAPWLETPVRVPDALRAAGNLAVDVVEGYLDEHPDTLCLHCGAAEIGGRLVIFPARARTGKSTLMARLAAEGIAVYADDVLPLDDADHQGISLGLSPRIRLPLPAAASTRLRTFVAEHGDPGDETATYLRLPEAIAPAYGRTAPLGAIVLLERHDDQQRRASLSPVSRGDALQSLIMQNLAQGLSVPQLVERLHRLVAGLPCFRLQFADLEDAVRLLNTSFPQGFDPAQAADTDPIVCGDGHHPLPRDTLYRRNPALEPHAAEANLVLVEPASGAVHHLNPVAAGVWDLLEAPACLEGIFGLFRELLAARVILPDHRQVGA